MAVGGRDGLGGRGLLNRVLGRATAAVRKPWHIYPVGVLFGLGFDTATEIGLLVLADRLGITSGPLAAIARLDLNYVGFLLVGLFAATWIIALLVWRFGRFEERWLPSPYP